MIWKDVAGYEGLYQVSDTGLVRSRKKILKQWKRSKYLLVDLWKNGVRDVRSVHVLIYETFNNPVPKGYVVHHKDEDKFNNCLSNLECMTIDEHNKLHCTGHVPWNKGVPTSKETIAKIVAKRKSHNRTRNDMIHKDYLAGKSVKALSEIYKICTRQIYEILKEINNA